MSEQLDARDTRDTVRAPSPLEADAAFQRLRQRFVDGRITLAEFEEHVEKVYSAQANGTLTNHPSGMNRPVRPVSSSLSPRLRATGVRSEFVSYILVMAMLIGIWAMTGMGYFWPVWPMMGWGIGVACKALGVGNGCNTRQTGRAQGGR